MQLNHAFCSICKLTAEIGFPQTPLTAYNFYENRFLSVSERKLKIKRSYSIHASYLCAIVGEV